MAATSTPTLNATLRDTEGTRDAKRLRKAGMVPGICYGHGVDENISIAVDPKEFDKLTEQPKRLNTVFNIELDNGNVLENVMLRDWQVAPMSRKLMHADLVVVDPDKPIRAKIPLAAEGEAEGVKMGGRIHFIRRGVDVIAPPRYLPEVLVANVDGLGPDEAIMADDLVYPENVEPAHSINFAIVRIQMPRKALKKPGAVTAVAEVAEGVEGEEVEGEVEETEETEA